MQLKKGEKKKCILMHHPGLRMSPCSAPREGCGPTVPGAAGAGFGQRRGPACDRARVRLVLVVAPKICPPWGQPHAPGPTGHPGGCQQPQGNIEERSEKHDGVGVWGIKRLSRTRSTHRCCRVTLAEPSEGCRPSEGTSAKRVSKVL